MNKTEEMLQSQLAEHIVAGEEYLGAIRVNYNGMSKPSTLAARPGFSGLSTEPGAASGAPISDQLVVFPQARQMAIALTGGRLLCWGLGMSGKPKKFLGEVPLSAVAGVGGEDGRIAAMLRIRMKSGSEVDLELLHGELGENFIQNLHALVDIDDSNF